MSLFGSGNRFNVDDASASPGPVYALPTTIRTSKVNKEREVAAAKRLDKFRTSRTGWMRGLVDNDVTLYSDKVHVTGPTDYDPEKPKAHRIDKNGKAAVPGATFGSAHRFDTKSLQPALYERATAGVADQSPGPAYGCEKSVKLVRTNTASFSFGTEKRKSLVPLKDIEKSRA
eukprot:584679_1